MHLKAIGAATLGVTLTTLFPVRAHAEEPAFRLLSLSEQVGIQARIVDGAAVTCVAWRLTNHRKEDVNVKIERVYISGELEIRRASSVNLTHGTHEGQTVGLADECAWPTGFKPTGLHVGEVTVTTSGVRQPASSTAPVTVPTAEQQPHVAVEADQPSQMPDVTLPSPRELAIYLNTSKRQISNYMTDGPKLDVGVGEIFNELDGTSESFGLSDYLRASGVGKGGMRVGMVDHPNEADLTVSGTIESTLAYSWQSAPKGPTALYAIAGVGALASAVGFTVAALIQQCEGIRMDVPNVISCDEHTGQEMFGAGVSVAGAITAFALLRRHENGAQKHVYTLGYRAQLTLRWKGKRVDQLDLRGESVIATPKHAERMREQILAPVWREVELAIKAQLEKHGVAVVAQALP